eukprot:440571-Pyramimonas_sp.AAC.1
MSTFVALSVIGHDVRCRLLNTTNGRIEFDVALCLRKQPSFVPQRTSALSCGLPPGPARIAELVPTLARHVVTAVS